MEQFLQVNETQYRLLLLMGKGKGGYSYLAAGPQGEVIVKQLHHEPCSYYQFGDKLQAELRDYRRLREVGIRMPALLEADTGRERIVKEYIQGDTILELIRQDRMESRYLRQVEEMCGKLYPAGLNIDYFPTNFVVRGGEIYYVDYECNAFMAEWSFENWGIRYWSMTPELMKYLQENPQG